MKKNFKLVALAALFALFAFSGCKNGLLAEDDAYYSPKTVSTDTASKKTITINASADEGLIVFPKSVKANGSINATLLPDNLKGSDLTFFLGHKKKGDTDYTFFLVDFDALAADATGCTGTVTGTFDLASYEFKLYAVETVPSSLSTITKADAASPVATNAETTIRDASVFAAYAAADLRYADTVTFYLSSNSLSASGKWQINVEGAIDPDTGVKWIVPAAYEGKIALYPMDSDTKISTSEATIKAKNSAIAIGTTGWTSSDGSGVASGTYNAVVTLTNTSNSKVYVYSEKVIILPNRTTKGTITVPNIIEYAPTRPADLVVSYIDPDTSDLNYYNVALAWTDTSYCERGFKLQLARVSADKAIVAPTDDTKWDTLLQTTLNFDLGKRSPSTSLWGTIGTDKTFDTNVLELTNLTYSQYINAIQPTNKSNNTGCLNMNNDHVTLKLQVGERFLARICAYNDAGDSDWTYLDLSKTATAGCTKNSTALPATSATGTAQKAQVTTSPITVTDFFKNSSGTAIGKSFDSDVTTMNRYKITYNLVGGHFEDTTAGSPKTGNELPALTIFESQHNTDAATATFNASKVAIIDPTVDLSGGSPKGTSNTYLAKDGTSQTAELVLISNENGGTYYWSKWKENSITGDDYTPTVYKGYKNLSLFAIYNTDTEITPGVVIENVNAYELEKKHIGITIFNLSSQKATANYITLGGPNKTLKDADGANNLFQIDSNAGQIQLTPITDAPAAADNCYAYDLMRLVVTRVNGNLTIVDQILDTNSTGWTFNVSSYRTGKYIIEITANTSKAANTTYSIVSVFEIVDDLSITPVLLSNSDVITITQTGNTLGYTSSAGIYTETVKYQWQKGGVNITGATSATYTLTSATDNGNYTLVVSNSDGSITASGTKNGVTYTPTYVIAGAAAINDSVTGSLTMNLSAVTVKEDATDITASETWTYAWTYADGVGGTTMPGTIAGNITATITDSSGTIPSGAYTCTATGVTSGKSVTATYTQP